MNFQFQQIIYQYCIIHYVTHINCQYIITNIQKYDVQELFWSNEKIKNKKILLFIDITDIRVKSCTYQSLVVDFILHEWLEKKTFVRLTVKCEDLCLRESDREVYHQIGTVECYGRSEGQQKSVRKHKILYFNLKNNVKRLENNSW